MYGMETKTDIKMIAIAYHPISLQEAEYLKEKGFIFKETKRENKGFELNPKFIDIAKNRIFNEIGLFHNV